MTIKENNQIVDLAFYRIISGFIMSLSLLIFGMAISKHVPLSSLSGIETLEDNINRYNLLVQITKYIFFPNALLYPENTILMHPLAYAGNFGLFITLTSLIPVSSSDGHKIFSAFYKKKIVSNIGVFTMAGSIGSLLLNVEDGRFGMIMIYTAVMFTIFGLDTSKKATNLSKISFSKVSRSKKKMILILLVILVLIFPISPLTNYIGYLF